MAQELHDHDALGRQATARAVSTYVKVRRLEATVRTLRRQLEQEIAIAAAHGMSHDQIANALDVSRTRVDQMVVASMAPVKPRRSRD